jgi:pyridoxamine 5'-phosphate oxidase
MTSKPEDWAHIRKEYASKPFDESNCKDDPFEQFQIWMDDYIAQNPIEPTAMTLSTLDLDGAPDSRVVLLKGLWQNQFVFYTNYQSHKGQQIRANCSVALNFFWPELSRQVRIKGMASPLPESISDAYFASRPFASQCSARVSPQSKVITDLKGLQDALELEMQHYQGQTPPRPKHWGGYGVQASSIEFWQGRFGRFHDRIVYFLENNNWIKNRLAP